MTFHKKPHKGKTVHKGNSRPCPLCGRKMRKVYDTSKTRKVMSKVTQVGLEYFCQFCSLRGAKKDYNLARAAA